ncbi:hypothetical protein [Agreia sp. COWG]|uniref:hypothetical protein n=1 Tax=Agreia sp. COWG TaxID=2773266 RepID=UPI0019293D70|nr:hypothetical protein [Agreia sp. COWG]CAD5994284.1 conserved protein of unknown function [Agreia sp. COWG]
MGWWQNLLDSVTGRPAERSTPFELPPAPTSADILASIADVQADTAGKVPAIVTARINRIAGVVAVMVPRLDQLGGGSAQAHTVVSTATSYLPEAVGGYLRLPREFADRRAVYKGKTSLMLLCDQLDLLGATLDKISDAVSRADAAALVAHGQFLAEKFQTSTSLTLPSPPLS